jgi:hypothetical protein
MNIGTQEVQVYRCRNIIPHTNIYLVDTPGFDDTSCKDTDVLKEIAIWFTTTYKNEIRLSGILYLHRISDIRISVCAKKNLSMFKKLCGPEGIKRVIFLTTFWEKVDATVGDRREAALQNTDGFWGYFVERGARVQRHWNTNDSAMAAIQNFIPSDTANPPEEIELAIQVEMVDSHKDLSQTSVGRELQSELQIGWEEFQNDFNERAREIKEEEDQEMRDLLREDQETLSKELQRRDIEIQELRISTKRMHEEKIRQLEEQLLEQQNESRKRRGELEEIRWQKQHLEYFQVTEGQRNQKVANVIRELRDSNSQAEQQRLEYNHHSSVGSQIQDQKLPTEGPATGNQPEATIATESQYVSDKVFSTVQASNVNIQTDKRSEIEDARTIYSDSFSVQNSTKQIYIDELVRELLNVMSPFQLDISSLRSIAHCMPDCLKAFSLRLGSAASSQQVHRDVTAFIRKYRE